MNFLQSLLVATAFTSLCACAADVGEAGDTPLDQGGGESEGRADENDSADDLVSTASAQTADAQYRYVYHGTYSANQPRYRDIPPCIAPEVRWLDRSIRNGVPGRFNNFVCGGIARTGATECNALAERTRGILLDNRSQGVCFGLETKIRGDVGRAPPPDVKHIYRLAPIGERPRTMTPRGVRRYTWQGWTWDQGNAIQGGLPALVPRCPDSDGGFLRWAGGINYEGTPYNGRQCGTTPDAPESEWATPNPASCNIIATQTKDHRFPNVCWAWRLTRNGPGGGTRYALFRVD
jgi:hypothetical protein